MENLESESTTGVELATKILKVVKAQIWYTAGQERHFQEREKLCSVDTNKLDTPLRLKMHIILLPEDVLSNILSLLPNKAGCFNISSPKKVDVSIRIRAQCRF
ncbi:hypothetical protein Bca101_045304 [Brassica carinata]